MKNCNDCVWHGSKFDHIGGKYGNEHYDAFYCLEPDILENLGYIHKAYHEYGESACASYKPNLKALRKLKLEKIDENR